MRLAGKRVIVTGAARGIGRGIAERFLKEGAAVALLDRDDNELTRAMEELAPAGRNAYAISCDLRDPQRLNAAAILAFERLGGIDILVNNAGVAYREPFLDVSMERWSTVMDINLRAVFLLSQLAARQMIGQGTGGAIVNMSSKNGIAASSQLAPYNASKAGVILLSQSMAAELAEFGIRVNAIAPGFVDTPLDRELREKEGLPAYSARTPMKRGATIPEVANVALFLASDEASYVTGSTYTVDGGHLANGSEL